MSGNHRFLGAVARQAVIIALVLLTGGFSAAGAQPLEDRPGNATWRLSWNMVDRGLVSWGNEGVVGSWHKCLAFRDQAIRDKITALKRRGTEVTENNGTIVERRPNDGGVQTVVHFLCHMERPWTMVVTHQSRTGAVSQERMGAFSAEDECLASLELEVAFKATALRQLGNGVSVMPVVPAGWTLFTTEVAGTEAGQLQATTAYVCGSPEPR